MESFNHITVLLEETVNALEPVDGGRYCDGTLGGAGHTELLLQKSGPTGQVLAFDQDMTAIRHAEQRLQSYGNRVSLAHSNFRNMASVAEELGFSPVDGVLFDLGVSSVQFDQGDRGFSFKMDAPLDMRMDTTQPYSAYQLVNEADEANLAKIIFEFGEEKFSRAIARTIVQERGKKPIETTEELAELVKSAIPAPARRTGPHPARRTFQAIRMAVNDELGALEDGLQAAFQILKPGGRIAVITFHSLEDRLVKQTFQTWATGCTCPPDFPVCRCGKEPKGTLIRRKPLLPSEEEITENPRSRSAKLRVIEKR